MTNTEINIREAVKNLEAGKLTEWEAGFTNSIRDLSKKELSKLSSKQYDVLRRIADK